MFQKLILFQLLNPQSEDEKWSFVFERLDLLLVPKELRDANGNVPVPADAVYYFNSRRNNHGLNQFVFETTNRPEFCKAFGLE